MCIYIYIYIQRERDIDIHIYIYTYVHVRVLDERRRAHLRGLALGEVLVVPREFCEPYIGNCWILGNLPREKYLGIVLGKVPREFREPKFRYRSAKFWRNFVAETCGDCRFPV